MMCPFCNTLDTKVIDSRRNDDFSIRRRRECLKCQRRFTTYEKAEQTPMMVIKKDGSREVFDVDKVRKGIIKACENCCFLAEVSRKLNASYSFINFGKFFHNIKSLIGRAVGNKEQIVINTCALQSLADSLGCILDIVFLIEWRNDNGKFSHIPYSSLINMIPFTILMLFLSGNDDIVEYSSE